MPRSRNTADLFISGVNSQLGFINGLTLARVSTTTYSVATDVLRAVTHGWIDPRGRS